MWDDTGDPIYSDPYTRIEYWEMRAVAAEARVEALEEALRRVEYICRMDIHRAAFSREIGQRSTDAWRMEIAAECRKLEEAANQALSQVSPTAKEPK